MSIQEETEKKFMGIWKNVAPARTKLRHKKKKTGWGLYDRPHFAISKATLEALQ